MKREGILRSMTAAYPVLSVLLAIAIWAAAGNTAGTPGFDQASFPVNGQTNGQAIGGQLACQGLNALLRRGPACSAAEGDDELR